VCRADNLTTFMCRLSWNLGASTSWNPQGLSRPIMGLLYLTFTLLYLTHICTNIYCYIAYISLKTYYCFLLLCNTEPHESQHYTTTCITNVFSFFCHVLISIMGTKTSITQSKQVSKLYNYCELIIHLVKQLSLPMQSTLSHSNPKTEVVMVWMWFARNVVTQ
jgi:hypothetical protein